jgi:hypothetical protein
MNSIVQIAHYLSSKNKKRKTITKCFKHKNKYFVIHLKNNDIPEDELHITYFSHLLRF